MLVHKTHKLFNFLQNEGDLLLYQMLVIILSLANLSSLGVAIL